MKSPSNIKLSIVFLNFNRLAETRFTLKYLANLIQNRPDIEVIAVDNGSKDGTPEFLETQHHTWLKTICLPTNTGIAGYNDGFQIAQGESIFVLDDDSHPVDLQTLDNIIQRFETQPEVGVVACQIENPQHEIVRSWHLPSTNQVSNSIAFVGCGFAIRRELFEQVGWYPREFFLYQNEIEVAIRVLQKHYEIYYDPQCRVIHRQSPVNRSNWRRVYYPTRNTIWIIRRYFPLPQASYMIFSRLCFGLVRAIQAGEWKWYYRAVKEALWTPIKPQILSPTLRKQLNLFCKQNSLWHQLTRNLT
ncbi:MAG: glycosyltransferase family 2 protein [Thiotrichaceae bacterium]|nr:glycosyltransferase family 2 protein [Thiotrichaceae bacterium]